MAVAFIEEEEEDVEEVINDEIVSIKQSDYVERLQISARHYLPYFFADKELYYGGKITKNMLFEPRRFYAVCNMPVYDAVDRAYAGLKRNLDESHLELCVLQGVVTSDIQKVIEVLGMLGSARIPQQLFGGMLLLYLELCEGVKVEFC